MLFFCVGFSSRQKQFKMFFFKWKTNKLSSSLLFLWQVKNITACWFEYLIMDLIIRYKNVSFCFLTKLIYCMITHSQTEKGTSLLFLRYKHNSRVKGKVKFKFDLLRHQDPQLANLQRQTDQTKYKSTDKS